MKGGIAPPPLEKGPGRGALPSGGRRSAAGFSTSTAEGREGCGHRGHDVRVPRGRGGGGGRGGVAEGRVVGSLRLKFVNVNGSNDARGNPRRRGRRTGAKSNFQTGGDLENIHYINKFSKICAKKATQRDELHPYNCEYCG